ncbi:Glutathione S-transferase 1, isoform C, partial [Stegodyphus mimosarum]
MTIDVYLAPASGPCRAVLMTAKFIGLDVNQKLVNLMAGEQLKPEFLKINPQHCVPTIDDNGFYLWESRAIQTYLVNKYAPDSNLYPKDPQERAVVDRLLYFDIGTLYKAEAEYLYPHLFQGKPADPEKNEVFKKALGFLDQFLSKKDYVAGNNITLADLSIIASLSFAAELADYSFDEFPKVNAWYQKVKSEIPGYKEINDEPLQQFKQILKSKK